LGQDVLVDVDRHPQAAGDFNFPPCPILTPTNYVTGRRARAL
jgi:hypothetical protein